MQRTLDRNKYLTPAEVRKLRTYWRDRDKEDRKRGGKDVTGIRVWMIVDLAMSTGFRVAELAALKVEHIDFGEAHITVTRKKKKKHVEEQIPLRSDLARHLKTYLNGRTAGPVVLGERGPLTRRGWQQAWHSACRCAGVRNLSIHKARHTYGKTLYDKTKDLRLVQEALGHSRSDTTDIYAHVTWERMAEAAEKMFEEE